MIKDIKIKDTLLVLKLKALDKLPISDGSGNPKGVNIDLIKLYVLHNIDILTSPKVDNNILKFTNGKGEEISVNLPDYQTYVNELLNAFNLGVKGQISGAVLGCNLYTDSAKSSLETQIATKFDLCVKLSGDNLLSGNTSFLGETTFMNVVTHNAPINGHSFVKTNGTSDELLVADGSVINKSEFLTSVPAATSDSIGGVKLITLQPISETATLEEVVTAYNALIEALKNAGINNI